MRTMTATRRTVTTSTIMQMTMTAMKVATRMAKLGYFKIKKRFSMTYLKMIMIESFKIRIF